MRLLKNALPIVLLALAACSTDRVLAPSASVGDLRDGLVIDNNAVSLSARVTDAGGAPIGVVSTNPSMMSITGDENEMKYSLQVEIAAPVVEGVTLPASHMVFRGTRAYVSYAPAGENLVGVVDVFDISTPWKPVLISSARFADSKITTMALGSDRLLVGTVTSSEKYADAPAVVEAIILDDNGRLTEKSIRTSVASHVVTGLAVYGSTVWVGSGHSEKNPGALTVLNYDDLSLRWSETLADVRAVSVNGDVVTVLVGSGAMMRLYHGAKEGFIREFAIGGLTAEGHKATIANVANWAFVAAGDSGVVFTRIRQNGSVTGVKLMSWGSPAGIGGVADEDAVTNAVAVSGSYVYAANGGAGVWVARGNWSSTAQNLTPSITPIGRLDLPGVSSNMVGVFGGSLFIAAGNGGLKIVQQPTP